MLVLGVGNRLLGDDGIGVRVVEGLGDADLPAGIRAVDGGTLGRDLLPLVVAATALIVVDAVDLRAVPGTVTVLRDDSAEQAMGVGGLARGGRIGDLLALARLADRRPERLVLVAIQPASIEPGLDLSEAVEAALPGAVELVVREAAAVLPARLADHTGT